MLNTHNQHKEGTMNEGWKYTLFFLGGVAAGAIGTVAAIKNKDTLKPLATNLISHGLDAKDAVARKIETARENIEDLLAEARHDAEQRREASAAEAEKA